MIMKKILLLDDEAHIRRDLGNYLQENGFAVHKASTIEEAKKIIISENLEYAIVDLQVDYEHDYSGTQVVNFIKRNKPRTKVIILSAYSIDEIISSKLQLGYDGYLLKGDQENYIHAVFNKIIELEALNPKKLCFVIMPFSDTNTCSKKEWTEIFNHLIKPAVEESGFNFECKKSEALSGNIIEQILDDLNRADLVIADLTDRNPNVFYELGVRHALRNATILITQNIEHIPFDLRPYSTQLYLWKLTEDKQQFKARIKEIIEFMNMNPNKSISPVIKYLNATNA